MSEDSAQFDVFLAHNAEEKTAIRELAEELSRRGVKPWLDEEQIAPGRSFQDAIQAALGRVKSVAVCFGPHGMGRWQALELQASISRCVEKKIPVIPVLLPGSAGLPDGLLFLSELTWVRFEEIIREPATIDRLVWGITGRRPNGSANPVTRAGDSKETDASAPPLPSPVRSGPDRPGRVVFALHGIRTYAGWIRAFQEVAFGDKWQVRTDRWNFGYFSTWKFLSPSARSTKVEWFQGIYQDETNDKNVRLEKGQLPSIVAHSFGTYLLGYAMLKYDWIRFDKIILCGSILPIDFPWDKLIERGQVQAVRNEFGAHDIWAGLVTWFVAGSGPSGRSGYHIQHLRFEQEKFLFKHSDYFKKGHMEANWLPTMNRDQKPILPAKAAIEPPPGSTPWGLYAACVVMLGLLIFLGVKFWPERIVPNDAPSAVSNGNPSVAPFDDDPSFLAQFMISYRNDPAVVRPRILFLDANPARDVPASDGVKPPPTSPIVSPILVQLPCEGNYRVDCDVVYVLRRAVSLAPSPDIETLTTPIRCQMDRLIKTTGKPIEINFTQCGDD